jgi:hypothetical protein
MVSPTPNTPSTQPLVLNIVIVLRQHPSCPNKRRNKRKRLRSAEPHRLEHQHLRGKVRGGNNMCPDTQLVQELVLKPVRSVQPDQSHSQGVCPEEPGGQGRHLVLSGGLVGVDGDELADAVFWVGSGSLGGRRGVGHEFAVVDSSCVVQGSEVLEGVAYCCYGDLGVLVGGLEEGWAVDARGGGSRVGSPSPLRGGIR